MVVLKVPMVVVSHNWSHCTVLCSMEQIALTWSRRGVKLRLSIELPLVKMKLRFYYCSKMELKFYYSEDWAYIWQEMVFYDFAQNWNLALFFFSRNKIAASSQLKFSTTQNLTGAAQNPPRVRCGPHSLVCGESGSHHNWPKKNTQPVHHVLYASPRSMDPAEPTLPDTWHVLGLPSHCGAHGPGPAGNRVTSSASPLLPPLKGKQKLLSPSLAEKHRKFPLKKKLWEKKKIRFGAIRYSCTQRSTVGFSATVRVWSWNSPPGGIGGRVGGFARKGMSAPIDRFATPSECQMFLASTTRSWWFLLRLCAFLFLRCSDGLAKCASVYFGSSVLVSSNCVLIDIVIFYFPKKTAYLFVQNNELSIVKSTIENWKQHARSQNCILRFK